MEFIRTQDLPKDCHTSPHHKENHWFAVVLMAGTSYYIPMTKDLRRTFGVSVNRSQRPVFKSNSNSLELEKFIRDIINSVYLQIRDTVGAEVYRSTSSDIKERFEKMYEEGLWNSIDSKLENKMVPIDEKLG